MLFSTSGRSVVHTLVRKKLHMHHLPERICSIWPTFSSESSLASVVSWFGKFQSVDLGTVVEALRDVLPLRDVLLSKLQVPIIVIKDAAYAKIQTAVTLMVYSYRISQILISSSILDST